MYILNKHYKCTYYIVHVHCKIQALVFLLSYVMYICTCTLYLSSLTSSCLFLFFLLFSSLLLLSRPALILCTCTVFILHVHCTSTFDVYIFMYIYFVHFICTCLGTFVCICIFAFLKCEQPQPYPPPHPTSTHFHCWSRTLTRALLPSSQVASSLLLSGFVYHSLFFCLLQFV